MNGDWFSYRTELKMFSFVLTDSRVFCRHDMWGMLWCGHSSAQKAGYAFAYFRFHWCKTVELCLFICPNYFKPVICYICESESTLFKCIKIQLRFSLVLVCVNTVHSSVVFLNRCQVWHWSAQQEGLHWVRQRHGCPSGNTEKDWQNCDLHRSKMKYYTLKTLKVRSRCFKCKVLLLVCTVAYEPNINWSIMLKSFKMRLMVAGLTGIEICFVLIIVFDMHIRFLYDHSIEHKPCSFQSCDQTRLTWKSKVVVFYVTV